MLKQILKAKGVDIPESATWHKRAIDSFGIRRNLYPTNSRISFTFINFQTFFVHSYGFMLDEAHLEVLANNITETWMQFTKEIEIEKEDKRIHFRNIEEFDTHFGL